MRIETADGRAAQAAQRVPTQSRATARNRWQN